MNARLSIRTAPSGRAALAAAPALTPRRIGAAGRWLVGRLPMPVLVGLCLAWPSVASAATPPPAPGAGGEVVEYYAIDALGSIRVVFTPEGAVVGRADYLPFGERFSTTGALPSQQFTGQQRDPEAQLDHFNARSYHVVTGRFTSIDPVYPSERGIGAGDVTNGVLSPAEAGLLDPQMWNRYAYARDRPFRFTDPTGRQVKDADRQKKPLVRNDCGEHSDPECNGKVFEWTGANVERYILVVFAAEFSIPTGAVAGVGLEVGKMYLINAKTGVITPYTYWGIGPSFGVGGAVTAQVGLSNSGNLSGPGWQASAFAAASIKGASGSGGGSFLPPQANFLTGGWAGGGGFGFTVATTNTWQSGPSFKMTPTWAQSIDSMLKPSGGGRSGAR